MAQIAAETPVQVDVGHAHNLIPNIGEIRVVLQIVHGLNQAGVPAGDGGAGKAPA
jgi:hypothetical protein